MDVYTKAWDDAYAADTAWEILLKYRPKFVKIVGTYVHGSLFDDMYSMVVIDRMARYVQNWNPSLTPTLTSYLFLCVRRNLLKELRRRKVLTPLDKVSEPEHNEESFALAHDILEQLPSYDAYLLRCRFMHLYTLSELSDHLGITIATCRRHISTALERARTL